MEELSRPAFGTLLRRYRLRAGFSQETLSERARMSVETVGALERGVRRAPYRETVALLAHALDLNAEDCAQLETASARPHRSRLTVVPDDTTRGVAASPPHNLPSQLSTLVGRDAVVAEVGELAETHRLVTLLGTGGVGKTRVALHAAANVVNAWRNGVWFVSFAPLADATLVAASVASTLEVQGSADRSVLEALSAALRTQQMLLVLDNCEHVIGEAASLVDAILRACPRVHILATSRERLNLEGEHVYRVPSLSVPPAEMLAVPTQLSADDALRYHAVALFAERALSAAGVALEDGNAPIVAQLCRRLDGIPLAIELAAARANVLDLATLTQRLDERFHVLTGGRRTALARQQTMKATLDWSHDLLSEPERVLFRRLSIFAGGWTLEAAEAVCADALIESPDIFELLSSLVDKSLVIADSTRRGVRYRFLESTRAFALEKLDEHSEGEMMARQHAHWVADFFERCGKSEDMYLHWFKAVEAEIDNARVAVAWALGADGDPVLAGRIAGSPPQTLTTILAEHVRWVEAALARLSDAEHPALRARLWLVLSRGIDGTRKIEAARRAVTLFEGLDDKISLQESRRSVAMGLFQAGQYDEARAMFTSVLGNFHDLEMARSVPYAWSLWQFALVELHLRRPAEARARALEAIALSDSLGDDVSSINARDVLSDIEFTEGNPQRSLALIEEMTKIAREVGDAFFLGMARCSEAEARIGIEEFEEAREPAFESLELWGRVQDPLRLSAAIKCVAVLAARFGDPRGAGRLGGYVDATWRKIGYAPEERYRRVQTIFAALLREHLTDTEITDLVAEGEQLGGDQALEMALGVAQALGPD